MTRHLYVSRNWAKETFKILCTRQWLATEAVVRTPRGKGRMMAEVTTVATNVTCRDCLEIIVPKERAKLERLEATLKAGREAVIRAAGVDPTEVLNAQS